MVKDRESKGDWNARRRRGESEGEEEREKGEKRKVGKEGSRG